MPHPAALPAALLLGRLMVALGAILLAAAAQHRR